MKIKILRVILFVLALFVICVSCDRKQSNIIIKEAELGEFSSLRVETDSLASQGQYLSMKDSGQVVWNIVTEESSFYNVSLRYRAVGGSKEQYLLKNGKEIPIGLAEADTWSDFKQAFYLNKGQNIIGIKASWGNMDIDFVSITPFEAKQSISPLKQTVYLSDSRTLWYKVDNYRQAIKNVRIAGKSVVFEVVEYPYQEKSVWLKLVGEAFSLLEANSYDVVVQFENASVKSELLVKEEPSEHGLTIVVPDVEHGSSTLIKLPNGKNMLIDTGKDWVRDSILIPMFQRNGIDTIHTLILTHYHGDHDSGDKGETIKQKFHVQKFYDYRSFRTGQVWDKDGVSIKILNCYINGDEENSRSLAFRLTYNGFVYNHGADTYAINQKRMIEDFGNENRANVFNANHHFHGSLLPEYIQTVNPDIVILQAQEAVYARSAFMEDYLNAEMSLNKTRKQSVDRLLALEVGAVVISVKDRSDWCYSTYRNQDDQLFLELK